LRFGHHPTNSLVTMPAGSSSPRPLWFALAGCALLAAGAYVALGRGGSDLPAPREAAASATASARPASAPAPAPAPAPRAAEASDPAGDAPPPDPGLDAEAQHPIDLERLRAKLPDNSYWRLGAPTKDPAVLRAREEDERRRNELYGRVLSNTASEEEIRGYYAERRKISEDYIEFAQAALKEYGDQLPDQERGLYELSVKMHTMRLREMPRQIDDALARKKVQDRRREDWQQGAPP
jgi:hypothetical protein